MQIRRKSSQNSRSNYGSSMSLREAMNRLFDESFLDPMDSFATNTLSKGFPAVDIAETEEAIEISANVPGVNPENITVEIDNNTLTISGEIKEEVEEEDENKKYFRAERRYGSFQRSFRLPEAVNPEDVEAKAKNGVLKITVPKQKDESTTKIEIKPE